MAKILRFPDGKILKKIPKSKPYIFDVTKTIAGGTTLDDLIRYFDEPSHRFETLQGIYKIISKKFRRRQRREKAMEHEWGS